MVLPNHEYSRQLCIAAEGLLVWSTIGSGKFLAEKNKRIRRYVLVCVSASHQPLTCKATRASVQRKRTLMLSGVIRHVSQRY